MLRAFANCSRDDWRNTNAIAGSIADSTISAARLRAMPLTQPLYKATRHHFISDQKRTGPAMRLSSTINASLRSAARSFRRDGRVPAGGQSEQGHVLRRPNHILSSRLFQRDARVLDDPGPFIVLALNKAAERLRRHGLRLCQLRRHFRRVAREYGSFADLISSNDCMRKDGVEPAFCLDHGLTISLYYQDPEGNFVELQSDNFSDWKLSGEFMRTSPDFAANPIGTFFDPAKVHDAFKAGTPFKTLQQTIRAGAYLPNPIPNIGLPG
jgi:hypothetical protein